MFEVEELTLYPMNFKEFLMAAGEQDLAVFTDDYRNNLVSELSERYRFLLKQYLVVGGMPEVVNSFVSFKDYDIVREKQLAIVNQ